MPFYEKKTDSAGNAFLETSLPGFLVQRLPLLNKGTSFSKEERRAFGLNGLIPTHVSTLEEQVERNYRNMLRLKSDFDKHIFLRALQDRSEVLFYALADAHLEEIMPLIYTPTVAQAVQQFSLIYRYPRGLVINTENIDDLDEILKNAPVPDPRLIVASDNEGILGIGDQGFGGMAICIGKLSLYTAAAGIDPAQTLPVVLDVGTQRGDLIEDPLYLGVRHNRLSDAEYSNFIERFVTGVKKRFPHILLQWEDFSKQRAFDVLEKYRATIPSLNDDIQGTGAVVLAGLLTACRQSRVSLTQRNIVVHGAGAGGLGVAQQIVRSLVREGLSRAQAVERVFVIDSKGLILKSRTGLERYKTEFAKPDEMIRGWKVSGKVPSLLETVVNANATVLLGLSGQPKAFDEAIVRACAANAQHPIIMALSNPTACSEVEPADATLWSEGRALMATGSPFDDVKFNDDVRYVRQGNNAFIFPGLGLGAMFTRASTITDGMLDAAAYGLAEFTSKRDVPFGALYPRIDEIRKASLAVAVRVAEAAVAEKVATRELEPGTKLEEALAAAMWKPVFLPLKKK